MTPTDQTRLAQIRSVVWTHDNDEIRFLLSLLSQETKRADEAGALALEEFARDIGHPPSDCSHCDFCTAARMANKQAAAVRRGREGEK